MVLGSLSSILSLLCSCEDVEFKFDRLVLSLVLSVFLSLLIFPVDGFLSVRFLLCPCLIPVSLV